MTSQLGNYIFHNKHIITDVCIFYLPEFQIILLPKCVKNKEPTKQTLKRVFGDLRYGYIFKLNVTPFTQIFYLLPSIT